MIFRRCAQINRLCHCNDAESVPCLAALIEKYLNEVRMAVHGKNCAATLGYRHKDIITLGRSFKTHGELLAWFLRVNGGNFEL